MRSLLFGVTKGAILAIFDGSGACQGNVLDGMSQSPGTAVAHGHFAVHFNRWDLVHQFQGVGTVFAKFVLEYKGKAQREGEEYRK